MAFSIPCWILHFLVIMLHVVRSSAFGISSPGTSSSIRVTHRFGSLSKTIFKRSRCGIIYLSVFSNEGRGRLVIPSSTQISNAFSTSHNDDAQSTKPADSLTNSERQERTQALHEQLTILGVDAEKLGDAVQRSMTTLEGNDPYYGKSAIKAYRTFLYPRPSKVESTRGENVAVAASRCARQIDFLAKRHRSHEAEWVRHTDSNDSSSPTSSLTIERSEKKLFPLMVLLDNVRSAFNVGSIFRTADACGCSMVLTTGITPNPNGSGREKLSKSALNADRVVPSQHFTTTKEAVEYVRSQHPGFTLVGMETTERSKCYTSVTYPGKGMYTEEGIIPNEGVLIVLGNEVHGIDTEIMPLLDELVELPMFGQKNSLNIAACAPVVLYEILRQWGAMEVDD